MLTSSSAGTALTDTGRPDNRRTSVRIPFVHSCRLTTRSRIRGGLVCNLSGQGVYVTLDEPLPERAEPVHVSIQLPGEEPFLQGDCVVAWQNTRPAPGTDSLPPGVGLYFVALAPEYQERVDSLMRQHEGETVDDRVRALLPNLPHAGPKRIPFVQRCTLTGRQGSHEALICNLSRLGAYVAATPVPEVNEEVRISFSVGETSITLTATVAWQKTGPFSPGCGVRFVALPKDVEQRVWALVEGGPGS